MRAPWSRLTGTRLLPMVKANGYGLGAVAVARALEPLDPWGYGVASVEEGAALRAAGITRPVLVLSPLLPDAVDAHLAHDLRPSIGDLAGARRPGAAAATGRSISRSTPGWRAPASAGTTGRRWRPPRPLLRDGRRVGRRVHPLPQRGHRSAVRRRAVGAASRRCSATLPRRPPLVHAANSAAPLCRAGAYAGDLIRPGIFLYGGEAGGRIRRRRWPRSGRGSWRCARLGAGRDR